VVASEEVAVLSRIGDGTPRLDDDQLARLFAVTDLTPGETFLADVKEVEPGTALVFGEGGVSAHRFWEPPAIEPIERADAEWEEIFRETLDRAVTARLRTHLRPSVLMSGGLDSTSVAALASRRVEAPLLASSWVFDELTESDERRAMVPAAERLGLEWLPFPADSLWPLRTPEYWPNHPNGPLEGLFRWPRLHSYREMRSCGAGVLLTGENGDHFFAARNDRWLREALTGGRWGVAARGVASIVGERTRWGPTITLRTSVGRAVGWPGRWRGWPARLTETALARLPPEGPALDPFVRAWRRLLDSWSQRGFAWESRNACLEGLEIRRPFRDRRLLELACTVPAHQLHRPPMTKSLLRRAMRDFLPATVLERTWRTSLSPLARRGVDQREAAIVDCQLLREDATWRRFVRSDWLFPGGRRLRLDEGHDGAMVWACFTLGQWHERLGRRDSWRGKRAELPERAASSHSSEDE
jgi:asparagine synthase (glutamine-hydrolysing)